MRREFLILTAAIAFGCASKSPPLPLIPAAWVRDDYSTPDVLEARRAHAKCDQVARTGVYDDFIAFIWDRKRAYRRDYASCMRAEGWILLPAHRGAESPPVEGIAPEALQCVGRGC